MQTTTAGTVIVPVENIYIVTNDVYADMTRQQLPEISEDQLLLEPLRRNTAPAIAFASYRIHAIDPKANIIVAPSDHLILKEELFVKDIRIGLKFVAKNPVLLTLGIRPGRPETGYGYIQINGNDCGDCRSESLYQRSPILTWQQSFWRVESSLELRNLYLECGDHFGCIQKPPARCGTEV